MKIFIFRHAKVNMKWQKSYNSKEFDEACAKYDQSEIVFTQKLAANIQYKKIYISGFYRSLKTAQALFPNEEYTEICVGEVPVKSFISTAKKLPLWIWDFFGRVQWFINCGVQPELRRQTVRRADFAINELLARNEDCEIVTHGFFMKTFISRLKKCGFAISGNKGFGFANLQMVVAEKN